MAIGFAVEYYISRSIFRGLEKPTMDQDGLKPVESRRLNRKLRVPTSEREVLLRYLLKFRPSFTTNIKIWVLIPPNLKSQSIMFL